MAWMGEPPGREGPHQEEPKITCIGVFRMTPRFVDLQGRPRTKQIVILMAVVYTDRR